MRPFSEPKEVLVDPEHPPAFFDAVTGTQLLWYSSSPDSGYKIWNSDGYDPYTGVKLQPVREPERDAILAWLKQIKNEQSLASHLPPPVGISPPKAPRRILLGPSDLLPPLVNSIDGKPIVWFSRSPDGDTKLYDAPGFDEETGVPLKPVETDDERAMIREWYRRNHETKTITPSINEEEKQSQLARQTQANHLEQLENELKTLTQRAESRESIIRHLITSQWVRLTPEGYLELADGHTPGSRVYSANNQAIDIDAIIFQHNQDRRKLLDIRHQLELAKRVSN